MRQRRQPAEAQLARARNEARLHELHAERRKLAVPARMQKNDPTAQDDLLRVEKEIDVIVREASIDEAVVAELADRIRALSTELAETEWHSRCAHVTSVARAHMEARYEQQLSDLLEDLAACLTRMRQSTDLVTSAMQGLDPSLSLSRVANGK